MWCGWCATTTWRRTLSTPARPNSWRTRCAAPSPTAGRRRHRRRRRRGRCATPWPTPDAAPAPAPTAAPLDPTGTARCTSPDRRPTVDAYVFFAKRSHSLLFHFHFHYHFHLHFHFRFHFHIHFHFQRANPLPIRTS